MLVDIADLKKNELIASLSEQTIESLANQAEVLRVGQGISKLSETNDGDRIYLILEGRAKVDVVLVAPGHPGDSFEIGPGDLFGAVKFFDETFPDQTFVANTELVALQWHASQWRSIFQSDPQSAYKLAMGLAKQIIQRTRTVSTDV